MKLDTKHGLKLDMELGMGLVGAWFGVWFGAWYGAWYGARWEADARWSVELVSVLWSLLKLVSTWYEA